MGFALVLVVFVRLFKVGSFKGDILFRNSKRVMISKDGFFGSRVLLKFGGFELFL